MTEDKEPRCWRCDRIIAGSVTRPWDITCQRCHARNKSEPLTAGSDRKV